MIWVGGLRSMLGGLLLVGSGITQAEPAPCHHPFTESSRLDPVTLREIGRQCRQPSVSALFLNRAYHAELLHKLETLNRLITYRPAHDTAHYHSQRIFIGLAEAFADRAWRTDEKGTIEALNQQYDRSIELVEHRLKGYGALAGSINKLQHH